jgi:hypothetical protein
MQVIGLTALVQDDSGEVSWGIVGVECNEPGAERDIHVVDDHTVELRASRGGQREGRIYTIWLQAVDGADNLSEPFPVHVTVPHNAGRGRR